MGLFDSLFDKEKTANMTIADPKQVFNEILKQSSGTSTVRDIKFNLFYQIFGFKGIKDGVGVSTMVANTIYLQTQKLIIYHVINKEKYILLKIVKLHVLHVQIIIL